MSRQRKKRLCSVFGSEGKFDGSLLQHPGLDQVVPLSQRIQRSPAVVLFRDRGGLVPGSDRALRWRREPINCGGQVGWGVLPRATAAVGRRHPSSGRSEPARDSVACEGCRTAMMAQA